MKKYCTTLLLVVIISSLSFSQISKTGIPASFKSENQAQLNQEVPSLVMPSVEIDR